MAEAFQVLRMLHILTATLWAGGALVVALHALRGRPGGLALPVLTVLGAIGVLVGGSILGALPGDLGPAEFYDRFAVLTIGMTTGLVGVVFTAAQWFLERGDGAARKTAVAAGALGLVTLLLMTTFRL